MMLGLGVNVENAKVNITVYHVNERKFGPIPINMNTGDATGDMFFDMLEVIMVPLKCENATKPKFGPNTCANPEAVGGNLMVNKLTLEVDSRFSSYAACNVCVNGTDPFHHPCKSGTYACFCTTHGFPPKTTPCNATVGYEDVYNTFKRFLKPTCRASIFNPHPTPVDCYGVAVHQKLSTEANGSGVWYSTLDTGYCGNASSKCTWRVVSVDKIVQRECHIRVFGAAVASTAPKCFDGCGDQKTNTSSPCWVDCFYKAALGPDAGKVGGTVSGMPTAALVKAWEKPFLPEKEGGCPAVGSPLK
jgi:hypothetical protein